MSHTTLAHTRPQRFHSIPTQKIAAVSMISLPNKQALALGADGRVYAWRDYMALWFATANSQPDWLDLWFRAAVEVNGKCRLRNGNFTIRTVRRGQ